MWGPQVKENLLAYPFAGDADNPLLVCKKADPIQLDDKRKLENLSSPRVRKFRC
jgi:hypothetical protein